mmetsp:Transcript_41979/g.65595  ORF Transcript_41979/g.65595 Transcript_41979/m.65595 type:complete len:384 (+) Transcript_41979:3721-4872(+)
MHLVAKDLIALKKYERFYKKIMNLQDKLVSTKEEISEVSNRKKILEKNYRRMQDVGYLLGEVVNKISADKTIIKAPTGTKYVVSAKNNVDQKKLEKSCRVALDPSTLTIMAVIENTTDPLVSEMLLEDPGAVSYSEIGGLEKILKQLREVVEMPFFNPALFEKVGITAPNGVLLYGPPGTGKTLLARAISFNVEAKFLKVVASGIVDKYIGESARIIREIFQFAKKNSPCIIFIDEIDAIGGRRLSDGSSADREIQRTLLELLNQLDGFEKLKTVKTIMATNRPDVLDPALLRPGRLDRKIMVPLPSIKAKKEILKIHLNKLKNCKHIDMEKILDFSDGFNGADLRNVCTEAGLFAIRNEREYITEQDLILAVKKLQNTKKKG